MDIKDDILCLNSTQLDGMPKAKYNVSDSTLNKTIQLNENEIIQKCAKEIKAVNQAILLLKSDKIIEEIYKKYESEEYDKWGKINKWDIINKFNISEETYKRRRKKLIYTIHDELNKL